MLAATETDLAKIAAATQRVRQPLRGEQVIALRVGRVIERFHMAKHIALTITDTALTWVRKDEAIAADLYVRPVFHCSEQRVRAHVFLRMLAYYVEWHMRKQRGRIDPVVDVEPLRHGAGAVAVTFGRQASERRELRRTADLGEGRPGGTARPTRLTDRPGAASGCARPAQCDISTGTVIDASMVRVTPPSTSS